ncbi:helix-turn-helix domain-containing protein [Streptomyces sp. NBC_00572]|uniref:helix-turn-helix domain-containing protein n=1 Tax=Streptomyces sp. NBC_00572 TaxID=2903664 RepID=UPI002258EF7D|nr:helix-turn-helix domain-containing protein [Streptomyces sp. NBC_00572]MCX4981339.1 helix-turn-helix domain-containing protein [Streptomyces sp. NBC_00572]
MPQTTRYTIVGNHLAQHGRLSLTAIGLALHIQSLPVGTPVGIKALAGRFPEGEIRVAAALRELEAHGYLSRTRERQANGEIKTRTVSYNQPIGVTVAAEADEPGQVEPGSESDPEPDPEPDPDAAPGPVVAESPDVRKAPGGRLPEGPAAEFLLDLRRHDARMLLSVRDIQHLAPGVDAWFARGASLEAVRRTLLGSLPETLRHPAGLLSHRLTSLLPPPLPTPSRATGPYPIQFCVTCDETAFRAPEPGQCPYCEADAAELRRTAA